MQHRSRSWAKYKLPSICMYLLGLGSTSNLNVLAPAPPLSEMPFVMQNFFLIQAENWILGKAGLFSTFTSYPLPLHYYWSLMEILWNSVMKLRLRTQILMIIWFCSFKTTILPPRLLLLYLTRWSCKCRWSFHHTPSSYTSHNKVSVRHVYVVDC